MESVSIVINEEFNISGEMDGTTFIVDTKPDFPNSINTVKIATSKSVINMGKSEIIEIHNGTENKYEFAIREIPKAELENQKIRGDIDYLSMMSGIDLEEG